LSTLFLKSTLIKLIFLNLSVVFGKKIN